jgi:hypothetical protein
MLGDPNLSITVISVDSWGCFRHLRNSFGVRKSIECDEELVLLSVAKNYGNYNEVMVSVGCSERKVFCQVVVGKFPFSNGLTYIIFPWLSILGISYMEVDFWTFIIYFL